MARERLGDADERPRRAKRQRMMASPSTMKAASSPINLPTAGITPSDGVPEEVEEDDLCPICRLLLCDPYAKIVPRVTTICQHTMCKSCMATWADVSISMPNMAIVSAEGQPRDFDAATGIEAKCPMCRTLTTSTKDDDRARNLKAAYPVTYSERLAEETKEAETGESIQTITIYIGNRHELVEPSSEPHNQPHNQLHNQHRWTFFVKPSRTDIIEEVHIHLHPTFRQNHIIRTRPPYALQRLGWGTFTIVADVILKAGYSWVSSDAEDTPDGAPKGSLTLEWMLDFSSFEATGAMGRCRLKVKSDRHWDDDEAARDKKEFERVTRQYERDGRYVPD